MSFHNGLMYDVAATMQQDRRTDAANHRRAAQTRVTGRTCASTVAAMRRTVGIALGELGEFVHGVKRADPAPRIAAGAMPQETVG